MRSTFVLLVVFSVHLLCGCPGAAPATPDGAPTAPPDSWTCDPSTYNAGDACDCRCGAPDPDCTRDNLPLLGCPPNELQPGDWTCDARGYCDLVTCGNNAIDQEEGCEDGNDVMGDGCYNCQVEYGFACDNTTLPSSCHVACGDGITQHDNASSTYENCDDGNTVDDDGCSADCQWVTPGYSCNTQVQPSDCRVPPTEWTCEAAAYFGNTCYCGCGIPDPDCTSSDTSECAYPLGCIPEGLYPGTESEWAMVTMVPDPADNSRCVPNTCGDGFAVGGELCDDGNNVDGDGCSASCAIEPGYTCLRQGGWGHVVMDLPTPFASRCLQVPPEWQCYEWEYLDATCVCGCGAEDPFCREAFGPDWASDVYHHCTFPGMCNGWVDIDPNDPTQCLSWQ